MSVIRRIKPTFWDHHDVAAGTHARSAFNFRRKWMLIVLLTSLVALTPLLIMTGIDYRLTRDAIESEALLETARQVSNTWRAVSFFLKEKHAALDFVLHDNSYDALQSPARLQAILGSLQAGVGGFLQMGVLNPATGDLLAGASGVNEPFPRCCQDCLKQCAETGLYTGPVIPAGDHASQMIIARQCRLTGQANFILAAALDATSLFALVSQLDLESGEDAFLIDTMGNLMTPSSYFGRLYHQMNLSMPPLDKSGSRVIDSRDANGRPIWMGVASIPDTPFILILVKPKSAFEQLWLKPRMKLVGFLVVSVVLVLLAIVGMATFLMHHIHAADQKRVQALHQVEYTNKLASLGRLAAGVAHEVNNPLAIINQKAGLIQDLFSLHPEYAADQKLTGLVNAILAAVERGGSITRRLLNFARHMETNIQPIDLAELVGDVLGFLTKEAQRRQIEIEFDKAVDIPEFESDRGSLQQILLNLCNNAFAAMPDGGKLRVRIFRSAPDRVTLHVADNGSGIAPDDLKRIFEPFFTTRHDQGTTGLGLSITYGLVTEIGGDIQVDSQLGAGTRFTVQLPLKAPNRQ